MCTRETPRGLELELPHGDVSSTTTMEIQLSGWMPANIMFCAFLHHIVHIIGVIRPPLASPCLHSTPTSSATNKNSWEDEEFELWLHVRRESHVEYPRKGSHPLMYWRWILDWNSDECRWWMSIVITANEKRVLACLRIYFCRRREWVDGWWTKWAVRWKCQRICIHISSASLRHFFRFSKHSSSILVHGCVCACVARHCVGWWWWWWWVIAIA